MAVTDTFEDGVVHAVWGEVLAFRKAGRMVMFDEEVGAKAMMKAVYNNPLAMWRKDMEFPCLARVARRVLAIPAPQPQSERMISKAGLTVMVHLARRTKNYLFFSNVTRR